jgi:hypothetical protein
MAYHSNRQKDSKYSSVKEEPKNERGEMQQTNKKYTRHGRLMS